MKKLDIIYLDINEEKLNDGIDAVSLVEFPAIEENFVALNDHKIELKAIDEDKRIVIGLALVPEKNIYRRNGDYEYYIRFSEETVRRAAEGFMRKMKIHNSTLEHSEQATGIYTIESWIVEDTEKDKSALYGLNAQKGSWVITQRIENDEIWNDIKEGKYKGFSIEGYFSEQTDLSLTDEEKLLERIKKAIRMAEKSFDDYPQAVRNNAQKGIDLNAANGNKCATQVGKLRAQQLANGEMVSYDTVKRMYSYLSRAEAYYDENDTTACGTISYLLWGGLAGKRWAESKINELENN
jgi:hypothetical protein